MNKYDVVVAGGGIHGAGVAQAAAAAGYSVLLLEQTAIAAGTSSRSSKLIHGGLRYLESFQFGLVRQSLHERSLMLKLAPDLVRLVPFHIPVYKTTRRRPWQIHAGLSLYSILGGLGADNRFERLSLRQWDNPDEIDTHGLQAVFRYYDGQTDDAALTRAVVKSAETLGARIACPARLVSAQIEQQAVHIQYVEQGQVTECRSSVLVNATGPWVNHVLQSLIPAQSTFPMELVRGTHIRVEGLIHSANWYLEAPQDGRAVFAMPREGCILIGTTESIYKGDPANVAPTDQEQQYLLNILAHYFPYYRNSKKCRILSAYAGLRVLPAGTQTAFQRSRETLLLADNQSCPRVISVYGGKLTNWRATAASVLAKVKLTLPAQWIFAKTDELMLKPDS